jgi:hypothetical protein
LAIPLRMGYHEASNIGGAHGQTKPCTKQPVSLTLELILNSLFQERMFLF